MRARRRIFGRRMVRWREGPSEAARVWRHGGDGGARDSAGAGSAAEDDFPAIGGFVAIAGVGDLGDGGLVIGKSCDFWLVLGGRRAVFGDAGAAVRLRHVEHVQGASRGRPE